MSGPWENYQSTSSGPWDRYAAVPAKPLRPDNALGFATGSVGVVNRLAQRADSGLQRLGVPMDAINHTLGFPTANEAVQADQKALTDAAARGVRPGKLGEFAGNVAVTAPIPGGPLLNGALTGLALSKADTPQGVAGDMATSAIGGKLGAAAIGGLGKVVTGVTGDALKLAQKGVPLTPGQAAGGLLKNAEDSLTSVPGLGDVIRGAQRRGIEGMNRAAFNDTLAHIGDKLPDGVIGHDAYNYAKQAISNAYDAVLQPLVVQRDAPLASALSAAKSVKIGDPAVKAKVANIIKTEVLNRFDASGQMAGEEIKGAQEALGQHISDLYKGPKYERDGAKVLQTVKSALEDLVSRTDPAAGDALTQVNRAYASLKPLETAVARPGSKDGIFTVAGMGQGMRKGKSAAALASGRVPHQDLFNAAAKVLPSSVPDSGSAGRIAAMAVGGGLLGHTFPITAPALGLLATVAAPYTKVGQELLTPLLTKRSPVMRAVGQNVRRLAHPAGSLLAVTAAQK